MKLLRTQVKFDENYSIYLNDINTIFKIYYTIVITKRKSYKEKIIDKLNAIGNDYLNKEKEGIKNLLTNDLREIVMKIKELHYQEAKDKVYNLMEENGTLDIMAEMYSMSTFPSAVRVMISASEMSLSLAPSKTGVEIL